MNLNKLNKYDKAYLRIAKEWSRLSYCKRKQVGAIIVKDRMIISDGYNGTPSGFENSCEGADGHHLRIPEQNRHSVRFHRDLNWMKAQNQLKT